MTPIGWAQIVLVLACAIAAAVPLGGFIARVAAGKRTLLHPLLGPLERRLYALAGVDPAYGQGWQAYTLAMLAFNAAGFALLYAILRLQGWLPFNLQGFDGVSPWLAFNTAVSFVTNTNWQAYTGEGTVSYFSQMVGLTVQNFLSAATGIALALALSRAFAAGTVSQLGNFWADMTRVILYVLMPLAVGIGLVFVALGMPQTLSRYVSASTLEGAEQTIALGPVAFQVAIKHLGTNGGGFFWYECSASVRGSGRVGDRGADLVSVRDPLCALRHIWRDCRQPPPGIRAACGDAGVRDRGNRRYLCG